MNRWIVGAAGTGKTTQLAITVASVLQSDTRAVLFLGAQRRMCEDFLGVVASQGGDPSRVIALPWAKFCLDVLRQFLGDVALIAPSEQLAICLSLAVERPETAENIRDALVHIRRLKAALIKPEAYVMETVGDTVSWLYPAYQAYLQRMRLLDSEELIMACEDLLRNPAVCAALANTYACVAADMMATATPGHWVLLDMLAAGGVSVLRTLDPFLSDHTVSGDIVTCATTYGIPDAIVSAIPYVMVGLGDAKMTPVRPGQAIQYGIAYDDREEAAYIAAEILQQRQDGVASFYDTAICYRSQSQLHHITEMLEKTGIPYDVLGKPVVYTQSELGAMLDYVRLVENPKHPMALLAVLQGAPYHFDEDALAVVAAYLRDVHPDQIGQVLPPLTGMYLDKFRALMLLVREWGESYMAHQDLQKLLHDISIESGYLALLEQENTLESIEAVETLVAFIEGVSPLRLEELLAEVLLVDFDQKERSGDVVTLVNVKNLEGRRFRSVFVCGLEEGVFPHYSAQFDAHALREETRLFYLCMTRATHRVYLTSVFQRELYGQMWADEVSAWVMALPRDVVACEISRTLAGHALVDKLKQAGFSCEERVVSLDVRPSVVSSYGVGDWVMHPSWGKGVVQKIDGSQDKLVLHIAFQDQERKVMAKYATLIKL